MTDQQWQQAWKLYRSAESAPAEQLSEFLAAATEDSEVREAVRQLLSGSERKAALQDSAEMPERLGQKIGRYVVTQYLGEGGMGAVYSARDSELGRLVAIKFLSARLRGAVSAEGFATEAKAASALNHPNIITIYEVLHSTSRIAIVMELVEGKSLRELCGTPIPADLVISLGQQIARALAAAHARGIIHCDIKPENLMLRQDGFVKVLDFGLARDLSSTMSNSVSAAGTLRYMSPEQSRGEVPSSASDIFSFGLVLYELAVGIHPFESGSVFDTLKALNDADPLPASSLNAFVPIQLDALMMKMLTKDPDRRPSASVVARLLESGFKSAGTELTLPDRPREKSKSMATAPKSSDVKIWIGAALLTLVTIAAIVIWYGRSGEQDTAFEALPLTTLQGSEEAPSFSRDGNQVAFRGNQNKQWDIYAKLIEGGPPLRLTSDLGTHWDPSWSPDGKSIAFTAQHENGGNGLFIVPALGGPERMLAELEGDWRTADWSPDGKWIAVSQGSSSRVIPGGGVILLSVPGGERSELVKQDRQMLQSSFAHFSPDGKRLAFLKMKGEFGQLYTVDLTPGMRLARSAKRITPSEMEVQFPSWTANGRDIVFMRGFASSNGSLARVRADGGAVQKIPGLGYTAGPIAIALQGRRLAFSRGGIDADIWRFDMNGKQPPQRWISSTAYDVAAEYSPNGKKIVFSSNRSGSREIWVCDADGGNAEQLTHFGRPITGTPRWSPDGRWIAFDSRPRGKPDVFVISAEGTGLRRLTDGAPDEGQANRNGMWQPGWSADGQWIYYSSDRGGSFQIWRMPWRGGPALQVTKFGGTCVLPSRDNQWIYYQQIQPAPLRRIHPDGTGESLVVNESIESLQYTTTSQGLYFVASSEKGSTLRRLSENGKIQDLLKLPFIPGLGLSISPDGKSILITKPDEKGTDLMLVEGFR